MISRTPIALALCAMLGIAAACANDTLGPSNVAPPAGLTPSNSPSDATATNAAAPAPSRFGARTPGVIFVTSQGLYYDTFVVKDPLPMQGRFQLLSNGQTEFGPGDAGYLGGRWWEDTNGNGTQDPEDHYFLCPLLPPGRPTP
jgi:hypothetical protein